jgi:hypothetical protein
MLPESLGFPLGVAVVGLLLVVAKIIGALIRREEKVFYSNNIAYLSNLTPRRLYDELAKDLAAIDVDGAGHVFIIDSAIFNLLDVTTLRKTKNGSVSVLEALRRGFPWMELETKSNNA